MMKNKATQADMIGAKCTIRPEKYLLQLVYTMKAKYRGGLTLWL